MAIRKIEVEMIQQVGEMKPGHRKVMTKLTANYYIKEGLAKKIRAIDSSKTPIVDYDKVTFKIYQL